MVDIKSEDAVLTGPEGGRALSTSMKIVMEARRCAAEYLTKDYANQQSFNLKKALKPLTDLDSLQDTKNNYPLPLLNAAIRLETSIETFEDLVKEAPSYNPSITTPLIHARKEAIKSFIAASSKYIDGKEL